MSINDLDLDIKKNSVKIEVFTDFDGTVTKKDLGDELFIQHGKFEPFHSLLLEDKLDIRTYWQNMFENLPKSVDRDFIKNFADDQEYDPYFKKFADFCKQYDIPLNLVSDGFDAYIKPIMSRIGADEIRIFCNEVHLNHGELVPFYPNASESCECKCASCKRNSMLSNSSPDKILVYIGDGYSDFCAAEHCDIIFAKKHLAAYCNKNKLPHYPFSTFFDVYRILSNLLKKGKLKIRNQAMLKRKKAFETE